MRHRRLAPASELKWNSAERVVIVPFGPEAMVVLGAVVSTVNLRIATGPLPAEFSARTLKA